MVIITIDHGFDPGKRVDLSREVISGLTTSYVAAMSINIKNWDVKDPLKT